MKEMCGVNPGGSGDRGAVVAKAVKEELVEKVRLHWYLNDDEEKAALSSSQGMIF